jgi:hypothetical protein
MYSKDRGISFEADREGDLRMPAYRQPMRPRMQVPPNYSGHAIVDGEEHPLGEAADGEPYAYEEERGLPASDEPPSPRFDDLPRVSELSARGLRETHRPPPLPTTVLYEEPQSQAEMPREREEAYSFAPAPAAETPPVSRGGLFELSRFPFGRGIGMEELLLLGLILFLLHESATLEDRGDLDETVLLLGLLLFLG